MEVPTLQGARVTLRMPTERDLAFALAFSNDEELRGWLRFYRPTTEAEERDWIRGLRTSHEWVWLIERRDEARPVGFVGLTDVAHVHRHAELGLGLLAPRGQGLGTEAIRIVLAHAFGTLALERVWLHVYTDNPAVRLYERLGFRTEGTLRRHGWKRGAWRDQVVMGLLREEWRP